ncbi:hydrogenase nickel incorporation protein HypB [Desulfurobacterium atlanticum]|uniref:Hydrogenase nickel incorporation protein HypB n=1 Tax=Desulfurobacterium atlanticum TaxID=240169 RepID=A0A238YDJ0_9BACT|nr:hydrogenase nickel incorporation protein HypB [Desulfurobacterium atlanticum]SNR69285.1 Hydrogenase nickel incorporation protein HypB [Desulfurobacterium atlanticum]
MCDVCGCGTDSHNHNHEHTHESVKTVKLEESLLKENDRIAQENRKHFDDKNLLAVNLISSPGSGKTTLLEKTIEMLKGKYTIGVLEGDIETERDAERVRAKGAYAVQLTTGGACHLEAPLVHKGFHALEHQLKEGEELDVLFIENVGNLVCPTSFDLGEHLRVVLVSVPEGPDKPAKYPKAFRTADVFIISKIDLLPYFDFDVEKVKKEALSLNPKLKIFTISTVTGEGMEEWIKYLEELIRNKKGT